MLKIVARAVISFYAAFGVSPKQIIVARYGSGVAYSPALSAVVISQAVWSDIREELDPLGIQKGTVVNTLYGIEIIGATL